MSELIYLPTGGALPGIPGEHAPGMYQVDYDARTIELITPPANTQDAQPAQVNVATEIAHLEDEIHTLTAEQQQQQS